MIEATFIGGERDGVQLALPASPLHINFARGKVDWHDDHPIPTIVTDVYRRLDDPVTGEFLGGYLYEGSVTE